MRLVLFGVVLVGLTGCSKLSKTTALELLGADGGVGPLRCTTRDAQFRKNADGVEYDGANDYTCADGLFELGILSGKRCTDSRTLCTGALSKTAELVGTDIQFPCGSYRYTIDSIVTEGVHATVTYSGSEEPLEHLPRCAIAVRPEGTFTATKSDDGTWRRDLRR